MKIYLDTIGCRLNQSEIETFARQFRTVGHEIVPSPEQADLAVVNTCAVTVQAAADSRKTIRRIARAGVDDIAVTGCWVTLEPQKARALPGVARVVPNAHKGGLVSQILDLPQEVFDREPLVREPLPGARLRTRAFIKVQDGCDNRCTFCITTVARGPGRSRPVDEVLQDIQLALDGSAQEVVLTGVHLGSWGKDFSPRRHLRHLIETILTRTDVPRLRLSSLEPWNLDAGFFDLWQDRRLCRHLHLPLQSGCNATLRRMARKTTQASFAALVEAARKAAPDIAITTDLIVGFPGESEAEFAESLAFVEQMAFAGGHVFTYSPREGTAAARMPNQVAHQTRKARNARMRQVIAQSAQRYRMQFINQTRQVLWESAVKLGPDGWQVSGLTDNYLRVQAHAPQHLWNQLSNVRLTALRPDGLEGVLLTG